MEHLIDPKDFKETLSYYRGHYTDLVKEAALPPAAACVVLLCGIIDTALRVAFDDSEE
jgi:hypothetical protein